MRVFMRPHIWEENMHTADILGKTQTQRLVYIGLSTRGPLTLNDLAIIVDGSPTHLERTLRTMLHDGVIRKCTLPSLRPGFRIATRSELDGWLSPAYTWKRDSPLGFWGDAKKSGGSQANSSPIKDVAGLQQEINRLWQKKWFTLGDENALRNLFPEFMTVAP
jgi:hypothetical protein